ncbi:MAG: lipopolysaccharide biosynthesis protein [Candidatus Aminicenantes bacterium]|nr:lipopolysaccharide biosynthesis protein [Candidatus Aminicenantes bacterium]
MDLFNADMTERTSDLSLSTKVIHGGLWITALRISNKLLSFIRIPILAWLLRPEDFGLAGIAALTIAIIQTFTQPGLAIALIRKKGNIRPYLDTIWMVSVIRSVCIFALIILSAPYVAVFFDAPEAEAVIRVFSITILIVGFRNPAVLYFQRELDFKKQYMYEFSTALANLIVSGVAAVVLRNVWALVLGAIAGSVTRCFMSYVLRPYKPRFRLDKEKFLELFEFGKWVLGSSMLYFLVSQGDDIVLGKLFGVTMLGLYQMAYTLSDLPTTQISQIIGDVTFPAYSRIQDDKQRLRRAYEKVLQLVLMGTAALAGGLFILAPEFTSIFLGPKWTNIVPILYILIWAGLLKSVKGTTEPIFNALGKPAIFTKSYFIQLIILAGVIFPLTQVSGARGIAIAVLISQAASTIFAVVQAMRTIEFKPWNFLRIWITPLSSMAVMILVVFIAKQLIDANRVIIFLVLMGLGALSYLVLNIIGSRIFGLEIVKLIKEIIHSSRGKIARSDKKWNVKSS